MAIGPRSPRQRKAEPAQPSVVAAVDLGSNSFRLQLGRVVDEHIYPLDSLKEPVRLGAGLGPDKLLDEASQARALDCLRRFGERLRGMDSHAVRAVGTNALRVAKNAPRFLSRAEEALGFPIEIVAGREEARLIYLGVSHSLPPSPAPRLVVDIGGGSTEFIIGRGYEPELMESLYMGCVSYSLRYFPDGQITKSRLRDAELAARRELQTIVREFARSLWSEAVGSSGSARALGDIIGLAGWSDGSISLDGLEKLRGAMLKAGHIDRLQLDGLRADRRPVLLGGFSIMYAVFRELGVERMILADGALRLGVLYDLVGRFHHHDKRDATVRQFMRRYHVDARQARRVERLAASLFAQVAPQVCDDPEAELRVLRWAAALHELGISVAYSGYHKHSAYVVQNADMPGFSRMEQGQLAHLLLAHRGNLRKMRGLLAGLGEVAQALCLRLAALLHRSRVDLDLPALGLAYRDGSFELAVDRDWLDSNPLSEAALLDECREWKNLGVAFRLRLESAPSAKRAAA